MITVDILQMWPGVTTNSDQMFHFAGKYSQSGCTLRLLLDWSWQCVAAAKRGTDAAAAPLFGGHNSHVGSEEARKILSTHARHVKHLRSIMCTLVQHAAVGREQVRNMLTLITC